MEVALIVGGPVGLLLIFMLFRMSYELGKIRKACETTAAELAYQRKVTELSGQNNPGVNHG